LIHAALKRFPANFHPDLDELTVRDNSVLLDITDLSMYSSLRNLTLCSNNLTHVPRLPNTGHLTYLDVSMNRIARIENLPHSIEHLFINNNLISSIDAFPTNVSSVNMWHVPLARFPGNLLLCARLRYIHFHDTEVNLTAMEMRYLQATTNYTPQQLTISGAAPNVYRNAQNVHTTSIQASFLKSCQNLFMDNIPDQPFTGSGSATVDEVIRTLTKNTETHCVLYVTFGELFQKVWNRIATESDNEKKAELLKRLREEITDARDKCFMGQVTRLLNVLSGFYDDIFLEINEAEQIYAKVQANQRRNNSVVDIDELIAELREIRVSEDKIMEWVTALKQV
jgi:Leucine-rich repeat (LRR) protein